MINEKVLELLSERLVSRIESANIYTLKTIGGQLKRIGTLTPSNASKLINMVKYGGSVDDIIKKLSEMTDLNVKDIYEIFNTIASTDYRFAKEFFDYKNIPYIPYESNLNLQNQVKVLADAFVGEYLSKTLGFKTKDGVKGIRETYVGLIDRVVLGINQGKDTYNGVLGDIIKEMSDSGLKEVDYASGYHRRLDSSVRMNILDGMRDLHNTMQEQIGKELGTDGVEISVHENPAIDHQDIQGKQFSNEEFEKLENDLVAKDYSGFVYEPYVDRKDRRRISTLNCYHTITSIILGISKPRYSEEELKEIIDRNNKGFNLDGKHYTMYEGKQLQRKIETEIRKEKDKQEMLKSVGLETNDGRLNMLANKYKEVSDVSGLPTRVERLKTYYNEKVIEKPVDKIVDKVVDIPIEKKYNSVEECFDKVNLKGIETSYQEKIKGRLVDLQNKYPVSKTSINVGKSSRNIGYYKSGIHNFKRDGRTYVVAKKEINFSTSYFDDENKNLQTHKRIANTRGSKLVDDLTTVNHEYGHALDFEYLLKKDNHGLESEMNRYSNVKRYEQSMYKDIAFVNGETKRSRLRLSSEIYEEMMNNRNIIFKKDFDILVKEEFGSYAVKNKNEFFAEGFANITTLKDKTEFMIEFEDIMNRKLKEVGIWK